MTDSSRSRRIALAWAVAGLAGAGLAATASEVRRYELPGSDGVPELQVVDLDAGALVQATWPGGRRAHLVWGDGRPLLAAAPAGSGDVDPGAANAIPHSRPGYGRGRIARAWLVDATGRYAHGVLGDRLEASGLRVELRDGTRAALTLDDGSVFEDLLPRVADVDGDGWEDVVLVRSYRDAGAALAVVAPIGGTLSIIAETPAIGVPYRWLNPVGVGDVDGDGRPEISYVETPHIGGVLRVGELDRDGWREEGARRGYSNHAMGSTVLEMGTVADLDGDAIAEIVLPTQDRRSLAVLSFADGRFAERQRFQNPRPIATAVRVVDLDDRGGVDIVYGLDDGRLVVIRR